MKEWINLEKIFTTQLIGRLQKIDQQELDIEDGARLLAQAIVGEGSIYIYAEEELEGIYLQAKYGRDPFPKVEQLTEENLPSLSTADRVLIVTKNAQSEKVLKLAQALHEMQVGFMVIGVKDAKQENPIEDIALAFVDLNLDKGLVPTMTGERKGFPYLLTALYVYHHMKLIVDDMVEDYE